VFNSTTLLKKALPKQLINSWCVLTIWPFLDSIKSHILIPLLSPEGLTEGEVVMVYQGLPLGMGKLLKQGTAFRIKNNLPRGEIRINANFSCS